MLPEQFLERMQQMLGEEYPSFVESFEQEHYRALRVNRRKADVDRFVQESPFTLRQVPWAEGGFYYSQADQPGKSPLHEAGVYYIQEPSAMAPVPFLEVQPGERVLDLCAAPGGKTTQIADFLQGQGLLISNEIHPARARILSENVERMGVINAIVTNETPEKLAQIFPGYFDKILVDAPCSGEGMFRKNEDACGEWSPENVALCADRQDEVMCQAAVMLRPGGKLVYSTCTFAPEEDEGTVSRFLKSHPEFEVVKIPLDHGFVGGRTDWIEDPSAGTENTIRLMPHRLQGEGHFLAVLQKTGQASVPVSRGGAEKSIPERDYKAFLEFRKQFLADSLSGSIAQVMTQGTYVKFGDQLYLGPKDMPALKGLKVLRPGLHLGTLKKDRFEPSHALALALKPEGAKQILNLSADSLAARQYLGGQTLVMGEAVEPTADSTADSCTASLKLLRGGTQTMVSDGKGWCLICVDGYSLGWGKLAGNIMKNHYPKGLRKG